jgi:hypothetical protein
VETLRTAGFIQLKNVNTASERTFMILIKKKTFPNAAIAGLFYNRDGGYLLCGSDSLNRS